MKKKELLELEEDDIIERNTKNMFIPIFGKEIANKFIDIYNAKLEDRDNKMHELYDNIKSKYGFDESKAPIVKYINSIIIAYKLGSLISIPTPLLLEANRQHNLTKITSKQVRLNRAIENLYTITDRAGFDFDCYLLPDMLKKFTVSHGYIRRNSKLMDVADDYEMEMYFTALLSKYAKTIPYTGISQMWFVLILMKTISDLTYYPMSKVGENKDIRTKVSNLINVMNYIYKKESERKNDTGTKEYAKMDLTKVSSNKFSSSSIDEIKEDGTVKIIEEEV
jgi:hypothetical protein